MKKLALFLGLMLAGASARATVVSQNISATFTCTGSTGPFAFTFSVSAANAITVNQNGTILSPTAYVVTPVNNNYDNGGSVTLNAACPNAQTLTITRTTPLTQSTVFADNMPVPMKSFENGLDKLTEIAQELGATKGGTGSVNSVAVANANGFQGTVLNPNTNPTISISVDSTHVLPTNTGNGSTFLNSAGTYTTLSGSGLPSGSQYQIQTNGGSSTFGHSNAYTDATGNPLTVPGLLTGKTTNGVGNTDQFASGGGNNGIANFFAANPTGTAMVPPASTDTEITNNLTIPSFGSLFDYRNSSLFESHHNSQAINVSGGIFCGATPVNGFSHCIKSVYDLNYASDFDLMQDVTFAGQGYNLGNVSGASTQGWSGDKATFENITALRRGIKQAYTTIFNSHAIGDNGGFYLYQTADGGSEDASGEGNVGMSISSSESTSYYDGTCATGCTSAPTLMTLNHTTGQRYFTDGSYLEDAQTGISNTVNSSTSVMGVYVSVLATPLTAGQVSTAWGTLAQSTTSNAYTFQNYISATLNVTLGTSPATPGNFVVGSACIVDHFVEQIQITAVGTPSAGVQSITFNSRKPYNSGAVIMQNGPSGLCGYQLLVTGAWPASLFVAGAFSTTQLVTAGCVTGNCKITNIPGAVYSAGSNVTMFPAAEIIGTNKGATDTVQLAYNTMNVAVGDRMIDPHPAAQQNQGLRVQVSQTTPVNGTTGVVGIFGSYSGPASATGFSNAAVELLGNSAPIDSLLSLGSFSTATYGAAIRIFPGTASSGTRYMLQWEGLTGSLFYQNGGHGNYIGLDDANGFVFRQGGATGTYAPVTAENIPALPTAVGQIPIATSISNANVDYQPVAVSGDATLSSTGALIVTKSNGNLICTSTGGPCSTGIANVQIVLPTTTLAANTCSAVISTTITGTTTTSTFTSAFASDPSGVVGYGSSGGLSIVMWPTANTNNLKLCNPTAASITPGAMTINVGVR